MRFRDVEECTSAFDIGRVDIARRVERERGGGLHHEVDALHCPFDGCSVPNVALNNGDLIAEIGIVERGYVERNDIIAALVQVAA